MQEVWGPLHRYTQSHVSTVAHVQSSSHNRRCIHTASAGHAYTVTVIQSPPHTHSHSNTTQCVHCCPRAVPVTHPQVSTSHTSSHWILILFSCRLLQSHNLDVLTLSLHTKMLHMLSGMYQTFTKCIITHLGLPAVTSIVPNSYDFIQVSLPVSIFHSTNISSVAE